MSDRVANQENKGVEMADQRALDTAWDALHETVYRACCRFVGWEPIAGARAAGMSDEDILKALEEGWSDYISDVDARLDP